MTRKSQNSSKIILLLLSFPILFSSPDSATADDTDKVKNASSFLESLPKKVGSGAKERSVTYQVKQVVRLDQIPEGSKHVRMWISIPSDEANQRLMAFDVTSAPGMWSIVEDEDRRGHFLRVDVSEPKSDFVETEVTFTVRRNPVHVAIKAKDAGILNTGLKGLLAEHLAQDAPHMEVTPEVKKIADEVCGDEQNVALQAVLLLQHVAGTVDHYSYSKDPNMPNCGIGDSAICRKQGGGCCTDLNSYFISLARARGIPARLNMGYRLQEKNLDKLVDPGYRCWVEYFVPNYGWLSADVVEADAPGGLGQDRWFSGLTARRVWLNSGREFKFDGMGAKERINHMNIAYAEIDGKPARVLPEGKFPSQITRKVLFTEFDTPIN